MILVQVLISMYACGAVFGAFIMWLVFQISSRDDEVDRAAFTHAVRKTGLSRGGLIVLGAAAWPVIIAYTVYGLMIRA